MEEDIKAQYLCTFPFDEILDTYMMVWFDFYCEATGKESDLMRSLKPRHEAELKGKWLLAKKLAYEKFQRGVV